MAVTIRLVDKASLIPLFKVKATPEQRTFVGPNPETIAQAAYDPAAEVYGIWDAKTAVGLIALYDYGHPEAELDDGDDPEGLYLWRLLIGAEFQRRGYGKEALTFAIDRARALGRRLLYLSAFPAEGTAIPFYEAQGFRKTERIIDEEIELVLRVNGAIGTPT